MSDRDVDAGEMFEDAPELEAFASDLRRAAADAPAPRIDAALAAVLDGSTAPAPSDLRVPVGRRRLRLAPRTRLRLALAGGVAAVTLLAIVAAGGDLPQPAQRNVARLADHVGVDLPHGDGAVSADDRRTPPVATPPASSPPAVSPTAPSTVPALVVPDAVSDADAVEDLRDGDDDTTTPGRSEEAPGQVRRPTDDLTDDHGDVEDDADEDEDERDDREDDDVKQTRPGGRPSAEHG